MRNQFKAKSNEEALAKKGERILAQPSSQNKANGSNKCDSQLPHKLLHTSYYILQLSGAQLSVHRQ